ncbi:MAG: DNA polymerase III subunit chi [Gammaproteobacteria bacterium]|nr:DNA polymerase III subunit chi [Gammaproteobacteria bacterium]
MQVDFYILGTADPAGRLRTACRLAEKAWQMGHRVYIHTESARAAAAIDELLWTFRQESFVPHAVQGEGPAADATPLTPVLIGAGEPPSADLDVLINLTDTVPLFAERSRRVAEIVGAGEQARHAGRERYRHYRDRGCDIRRHDL